MDLSVKNFMNELIKGKGIEGNLIKVVFTSLLTSLLILGLLYFTKFRGIDNFFNDYGFFLFFGVLIYAFVSGVLYQIRAFGVFPCMSGMMIGMTLGMIGGFIPGFVIASTNGMFVGAVFGMIFGISVGIIAGSRCCGVMGFLEGIMSGFMGGLMGAMTAFMLLNDNLRASTWIVSLISVIILIALNYMLYLESKQLENKQKNDGMLFTIGFTFFATVVTAWLMIYGPKSGVFG